jgi:hypothetical protein
VGRTDFKSVETHRMSLVGSTPAPSANINNLLIKILNLIF